MTSRAFLTMPAAAALVVVGVMAATRPGPAWAEGPEGAEVGTAVLSVNQVEQVSAGTPLPLPEGAKVLFDSLIRTGLDSANKDVLADGTQLVLGPGAEVRVDRFIYDPPSGDGEAELEILSGAMRWASGAMTPTGYKIKTPTAVIGIRGTCLIVAVTDARESVIVVEFGAATVTGNSGRRVDLGPDEFTLVDPAGVPSRPRDVLGSAVGSILGRLNTDLAILTPLNETLCPMVFPDLREQAARLRAEARATPAATQAGTFGGDGTATHVDLMHLGLTGGGNDGGGNDEGRDQPQGNEQGNDNDANP